MLVKADKILDIQHGRLFHRLGNWLFHRYFFHRCGNCFFLGGGHEDSVGFFFFSTLGKSFTELVPQNMGVS